MEHDYAYDTAAQTVATNNYGNTLTVPDYPTAGIGQGWQDNATAGYGAIPTPAYGNRLTRCSGNQHHFECKHEKQCDCGRTERVPEVDGL